MIYNKNNNYCFVSPFARFKRLHGFKQHKFFNTDSHGNKMNIDKYNGLDIDINIDMNMVIDKDNKKDN